MEEYESSTETNLPRYYPFEDVQAIKDNINDEITALEHLDANDIDGLHEQRLQQIKKITEMSSLALTMEKKYDCFVAALEKIVGNKTSNEIYVRFASLYDSIVLEQFDLYGQNDIHREHVQLENEGRKAFEQVIPSLMMSYHEMLTVKQQSKVKKWKRKPLVTNLQSKICKELFFCYFARKVFPR
ncbi:hypothetical protein JHK84_047783 [Glycine max]|nr:hypothetical protein JHK86_047763 [Glycine max]KAG4943736.1 hypothetical protein JHK85_048382 [Glycine max]KAG5102814.1 hypothetical protein JHK84_047783 [Glycine max]